MNQPTIPNLKHDFGAEPLFKPGETVKVKIRFPVAHYRVPRYIRGRNAVIESVIHPRAVNNENEGFGQNAGIKHFYYRVAIPLSTLWTTYAGSPKDNLRLEVIESWLERI